MKEPEMRLGVRDKNEIKQHPFFKDFDWEKLLAKELPLPYLIDPDNAGYLPGTGRSVIF
jgi:serine/threonine kinase 32